jgi:peptidylprolyl isomerase
MSKSNRVILISILTAICLFGATIFSACSSTPIAKNGDSVQVNYTLTLADGSLVETSVGGEPIEVVIGEGNYLADFEKAIVGMKVGESKTITILAADAYGEYSEELIFTFDRSHLEEGTDPKVGDTLQSINTSGQTVEVVVTAVSDTTITVDANSPLAGKDLTFKIDLLKIN